MGRDRIHLPGLPRDAARVLIAEIEALKDEQARLRRKAGRAGIVTSDYSANAGEFVNVEARSGTLVTITLPESTPALRGARITLAFRNSNDVRIVAVQGTVNGEPFVINDRPGTYDATADGLGGWFVQVGVSDAGSGAGGGGGGGGFTPTFDTPVDVGLANAEGVSTDLARADHVHRDRIATGSTDGFLSRAVFVNAASARVGTTIWGQTIQAATTWTTDADIPDGNWFEVIVWAAGGSGANGMFRDPATNTNSISGPGGGGGGACNRRMFSRAELLGALPIAMTVASDSVATAVATTVTTSHNGTMGGFSHFGSLLSAFGGAGGRMNNNTATGSTGGGLSHPGIQAVSGINNAGGGAPTFGLPGYGGYGGGAETTAGAFSATGGGGGAGGVSSSTLAGGGGGRSASGGGAGGGAGAAVQAGTTLASCNAGGAGGLATSGAPASETGGGGTAGAVGTTSLGGDGGGGADALSPAVGGTGGGGGASAAGNSGQGGAGGAGGFPAGGGGGGGSARGVAGTARGGLGGTGAGGCICITAFA